MKGCRCEGVQVGMYVDVNNYISKLEGGGAWLTV